MIDLISNGQFKGDLANYMASRSLTPERMRPWVHSKTGATYVTVYIGGDKSKTSSYRNIQVNAGTLRRDEWEQLDEALTAIRDNRISGAQDLISKGLTYNLGNAMGTTVLEWHDVSDMSDADMTMDGVNRAPGDRPVFQYNYLPIPIIHYDYEINMRVLEASRRLGNPLDTTYAERAGRKCLEKLDKLLFTNTTYAFGQKDDRSRNSIYSYVNHPDRNQVTLSKNWDDSACDNTPKLVLDDVIAMKQALIDARFYGPYKLYIPTNYETVMDEDYQTSVSVTTKSGTSDTIRDRILKIGGVNEVAVADNLASDNVLLIQMTSDVIRLVNGMGLTNVEWKTEGNFVTKYKVMMIQVPQIRSDQDGRCGIAHLA